VRRSPLIQSQSIAPTSCASSCLRLMLWSSRARNRSPNNVVACFFGRIVRSDATKESCFVPQRESPKRNCKDPGLQSPKPCNEKPACSLKKRLSINGLAVVHGRLNTTPSQTTNFVMSHNQSLAPFLAWISQFYALPNKNTAATPKKIGGNLL
jgi:hypothetical protein